MWILEGEKYDNAMHTYNRYGIQLGTKIPLWGGFTGNNDFTLRLWTPKPKMNWRDPPPLKPAPLKPELYGLSQWLGLGFNTHQGSLPVPGRCVHPLVQR